MKYELTSETKEWNGHILHRIKCVDPFNGVQTGELGGWVESEKNLSQNGNAWVSGEALVCGDAEVYGNAIVYGDAKVYGNAWVYNYARVFGEAEVYDNACIFGDARVCEYAMVFENARVYNQSIIYGRSRACGNAYVFGNAVVCDVARVFENAKVHGNAYVFGNAYICGNAEVKTSADYMVFKNNWSSGRYFTWTRSNEMWKVGCFYGTGEELIKKAYADSENSGKHYEAYARFVETLKAID